MPAFLMNKWVLGGIGAALLLLLFWLWLDSYGDRRYTEGVSATDAKWEEASQRMRDEAANSATRADDAAANRLATHLNQVAEERNQIDAAAQNGSSPLDVLFGG
jgi:hypothetical protein